MSEEKTKNTPDLLVAIRSDSEPTTQSGPCPWPGCGDSQIVSVSGQVREIVISRENELQFGITIKEDGTVIITDYGPMCFEMDLPRNLVLNPARPWAYQQATKIGAPVTKPASAESTTTPRNE